MATSPSTCRGVEATMPSDDEPALTLEFVGQHSRRRRIRFVCQDPGGWDYVEEQRDDGEWRELGTEATADLEVSVDAAVVDIVDINPSGSTAAEPNAEEIRGP